MSYLRFVIPQNDEDSGRRQGLFQALYNLDKSGALFPHEKRQWDEIKQWFDMKLQKPKSFSRSSKPHSKNVAISWFKDTAVEHIRQMRSLMEILEEHGIHVETLRTERPGYIVYEDKFQVAAVPFTETTT